MGTPTFTVFPFGVLSASPLPKSPETCEMRTKTCKHKSIQKLFNLEYDGITRSLHKGRRLRHRNAPLPEGLPRISALRLNPRMNKQINEIPWDTDSFSSQFSIFKSLWHVLTWSKSQTTDNHTRWTKKRRMTTHTPALSVNSMFLELTESQKGRLAEDSLLFLRCCFFLFPVRQLSWNISSAHEHFLCRYPGVYGLKICLSSVYKSVKGKVFEMNELKYVKVITLFIQITFFSILKQYICSAFRILADKSQVLKHTMFSSVFFTL